MLDVIRHRWTKTVFLHQLFGFVPILWHKLIESSQLGEQIHFERHRIKVLHKIDINGSWDMRYFYEPIPA